MDPTPQCPVCGSTSVNRDEEIATGMRHWICRDCGNVWQLEPPGRESAGSP